jgi:hypothetical protein
MAVAWMDVEILLVAGWKRKVTRIAVLASLCVTVLLFTCNISRTVERISIKFDIVLYRPVARQISRREQRIQPFLCNRRIIKRPLLSKGSINTEHGNEHARKNNGTVLSMWSVQRSYKGDSCRNPISWGLTVQLSSVREAKKRWNCTWIDNWKSSIARYTQERKYLSAGCWRISTVGSRR